MSTVETCPYRYTQLVPYLRHVLMTNFPKRLTHGARGPLPGHLPEQGS